MLGDAVQAVAAAQGLLGEGDAVVGQIRGRGLADDLREGFGEAAARHAGGGEGVEGLRPCGVVMEGGERLGELRVAETGERVFWVWLTRRRGRIKLEISNMLFRVVEIRSKVGY